MKTLYSILVAMLSIALTIPLANAGELAIPNTFVSGTAAKAAEVNANFTAVKTEVDDNNIRIETIETQTQNLGTGCPAGEAVAKIAADGTITCEADTDTTYSAGTGLNLTGTQFRIEAGDVSISAQAFDSKILSTVQVQYCVLQKGANSPEGFFIANPLATNAGCDAVAGVQLPDNVVMTGLHCLVLDNDSNNDIKGELWRTNLGTGDAQVIYITDPSVDSVEVQTINGITADPLRTIVDNGLFAYYVVMNYSTSNFVSLAGNGAFHGCRISYTP